MDIQTFHRELAGDQAREEVRVAHALGDLPQISDEFRQGRISFSKVRAMTRVATPDNEDYLLMIARHGTAAHVERLVSQYRKVKRIEALEAENQRHDMREMNWYIDDDGSYVIKARLTPEQGERVLKADPPCSPPAGPRRRLRRSTGRSRDSRIHRPGRRSHPHSRAKKSPRKRFYAAARKQQSWP